MTRSLFLVCPALACLLPPAVVASENAAPLPPSPWVSYVTPSREHDKLGRFTGTWTADVSLWLGADQPPHRFTLKADTAMTLGGRFHETRLLGMIEGMVFEEVAVLGFDNATRKFTRTVANTFGTGLLVLQGEWAASEDAIDLRGEIT
ncbi:MAG TPA: DUF1579 family protein, partial [Opitutus sp.]|nr:DUF1579 family protein [Opitutus sp.]